MSSAFLQIQNGIAAALSSAPALAGGNLQLNSLRPIAEGVNTALVVRLGNTAGNEETLGTNYWLTNYTVECYARVATGVDPASGADALLLAVWDRIAALDPSSIGASEITLSPQIDWQYDDSATPLVCAVVRLSVAHRTPYNSLLAA